MRYPGTIVVEILDPIPPGLPRSRVHGPLIETRIETACDRLIAEAAAAPNPPPLPPEAAASRPRSEPARNADIKRTLIN